MSPATEGTGRIWIDHGTPPSGLIPDADQLAHALHVLFPPAPIIGWCSADWCPACHLPARSRARAVSPHPDAQLARCPRCGSTDWIIPLRPLRRRPTPEVVAEDPPPS
jgi:hypothetical protein